MIKRVYRRFTTINALVDTGQRCSELSREIKIYVGPRLRKENPTLGDAINKPRTLVKVL